jgi:DNA polymerase-1
VADTATLLAVDGTNLLVRAIKALERKGLEAHGTNTGPTLAFIRMLCRHVRSVPPPRKVVVCWDSPPITWRTEILPSYKGNRATSTHEEYSFHFTLAQEYLKLAGVEQVTVEGCEADDLIAVYWKREPWRTMVILSGDKDLLALVDTKVTMLTPEGEVWTMDRIKEKYHCDPWRLPQIKAMAGDPSDGIAGLANIGPVKALRLIEDAGGFQKLLDNPPMTKLAEKVHDNYDLVRANFRVMDLRGSDSLSATRLAGISVPEIGPWRPVRYRQDGWEALSAWLQQYDMATIRDEYIGGAMWK